MEAMAGLFVGTVVDRLIDDFCERLKGQFKRQPGLEEKLQNLRHMLLHIQAAVSRSVSSQIEIKDPDLSKWLWKLRDVLDEAYDVLDEFDYVKPEEQVSKYSRKRKAGFLDRVLEISKRPFRSDPRLNKLEEAVHKLHGISAEVSTFLPLLNREMQELEQQQLELHRKRETGSAPTVDLLVRSKDMDSVRQWLRNPYQAEITNRTIDFSNISLLCVVGLCGMGKTTLLQHVYQDDGMTEEFDIKIWVWVSNKFDPIKVIKGMLEYFQNETTLPENLGPLQSMLGSKVKSKRFLLVLDDIWEGGETEWKKVLAPLLHASPGSHIFITTRLNSVASKFAKIIKNNKMLQLESLEEEECLQLFNAHAFDDVENPDGEFRSIAEKMAEKLLGCPLAAKVIGVILNSKLDLSYWTQALNTDIGNIQTDKNDLLPTLKLSYIDLSKTAQVCFTFCSIFPQDHKFDQDDLVRMWIALGFFQSSNQRVTIEDTGRSCFNELVQKSFFDECKIDDDRAYYKMHNLLHVLAESVSAKECFRVVEYDKELPIVPITIRHLSINTPSSNSLEPAFKKIEKFKNLHSLFLSYRARVDENFMNALSKFFKSSKSIRLLVISTPYLEKVPETIDQLIHLRYLKLDCEKCISWGLQNFYCDGVQLPRSISHLYHLQYIISEQLQIVEMDDIDWHAYNWLIMDKLIIKDPFVLLKEPLRNISSFRCLTIKENDNLVSFSNETEQWFLQDRSSLFELKFDKLRYLESLPYPLESLSSLETLCVSNIPRLKLLPNPPASMTTLRLYDLKSLQRLPSSLSTLFSLKILSLKNIPHLNPLPDLPSSLKELEIEELKSLQWQPYSLSTCSSLTHLKLNNIPHLEALSDLPLTLMFLHLIDLDNLDSLPSYLPTTLNTFLINKVPRLLELPDLPASLEYLRIIKVPLLHKLPYLPASLKELEIEELESLQCLPSCLSTTLNTLSINKVTGLRELPDLPASLEDLRIIKVPWLQKLPDLPASLKKLEIEELKLLQCLPSCLPTILNTLTINKLPRLRELPDLPDSLEDLRIIEIPWLHKLPDLPASLKKLEIEELELCQCLPSCLPTTLNTLSINKVPRLRELPDLPDSLRLKIKDCHSQLMELYEIWLSQGGEAMNE